VLDALSHQSKHELSIEAGVEIRTLFKVPMSPPTEEIRHWANKQKSVVLRQVKEDLRFKKVSEALGEYCEPPRRAYMRSNSESISQTSRNLSDAINHARRRNDGKMQVHMACQESKPHLIRHLSLNEVVHDPVLDQADHAAGPKASLRFQLGGQIGRQTFGVSFPCDV
jgi:hypothetical protein